MRVGRVLGIRVQTFEGVGAGGLGPLRVFRVQGFEGLRGFRFTGWSRYRATAGMVGMVGVVGMAGVGGWDALEWSWVWSLDARALVVWGSSADSQPTHSRMCPPQRLTRNPPPHRDLTCFRVTPSVLIRPLLVCADAGRSLSTHLFVWSWGCSCLSRP